MKFSRWAAKEVRIAFEFDKPARASDSNQWPGFVKGGDVTLTREQAIKLATGILRICTEDGTGITYKLTE